MEQVKANTLSTIPLGRQGENLARQILFDVSGWESEYGPGSVELIAQRPGDETPYPVVTTRDGDSVVWSVTAADTLYPGDSGRCELRYYVGETLAKSRIWGTYVARAMDTPSETAPPEPEQGWVDQIIAVGAAAKASADAAKADADRASELAAQAAEKAAQTAQDASDAAKAMDAAQTAQRLAEEAQGAAEAARTAAAAAQAAAEQSATDAAGAKQDAETAQKAAQDAAAAAAKALADIRALYQEMQTWAQGVIQDVNAAGSAAVQSVQSAGDAQIQRVAEEGTRQTSNAKAQADAAAQSAAGAAQSAQKAAESAAVYGDVVADVTQLKQDVAAITPDDTTVDGKPWTSKKIVDSLCQPFEENGNPVQCYPVEHYPLGVKVQIEPTQEGSGDPSPDNIRPISGRDSVSVTRCGKNLVEHRYAPGYTETKNGLTFTVNDDYSITVKGTATKETYFNFKTIKREDLITTNITNTIGSTVVRNGFEIRDIVVQPYPSDHNTRLYLVVLSGEVVDTTYYPTIVYGTTATPYEPYTGSTTDVALPETVYGGTLDVEAGVVTVDYHTLILTGNENWQISQTNDYYVWWARTAIPTSEGTNNGYCTHYPFKKNIKNVKSMHVQNNGAVVIWYAIDDYPTVDDWKAYLAAQYAAGTPVQVCYKLQNPYTIQLSPQQISALSGVNTLYTDANGVIVTGAEDPKHTITELKNAIISLGGNV